MAGEPQEQSRSARDRALYDLLRGGVSPNPFPRPSVLSNLRQQPGLNSVATIGGQRFRQVDDGRANVLIPAEPLTPPAELAQQRATAERALFMANYPLAGLTFGVATAAGASPEARDRATAASGAVNAVMLGAVPLGARGRSSVLYPPRLPPLATKPRDPIRYEPANASGQAGGANATVVETMLRSGEKVNQRLAPPGWRGNGDLYEQDRSHLIARELGGTGRTTQEVVALDRRTNQKLMRPFETTVARRVGAGKLSSTS